MPSAPQPENLAKVPTLTTVALISLTLQDPLPVLLNSNYSKQIVYVNVLDGTIATVKNDLGFELDIKNITGNDHITNDTEVNTSYLDVNLYGTTPNGSGAHITYKGLVSQSEQLGAVLSGTKGEASFDEEYININVNFRFAESVEEKYRWATKTFVTGKGRFVRNDEGFFVQYYLYAVKW